MHANACILAVMSTPLLTEIDRFLSETGMSEYTFGFKAVKNGRLVERLRQGQTEKGRPIRVWPETEQEIRAFMRFERQRRKELA